MIVFHEIEENAIAIGRRENDAERAIQLYEVRMHTQEWQQFDTSLGAA